MSFARIFTRTRAGLRQLASNYIFLCGALDILRINSKDVITSCLFIYVLL